MNAVYEFLKNKTFYLATVENNKPKLRPFGAVAEFENNLYFVTSSAKDVYKQLVENQNVCLCACSENRQWVRVEGIAVADERKEAKQKMLDENPVLTGRKRYLSADDPAMKVFYLKDMTAEFY